MALQHGSEHYTKWTHVENGQVLSRRLHRMEIQARNGRLYIITGDKLPDFLQTCSGHGYKGRHVAQILLSPDPHVPAVNQPYWPVLLKTWPTWRDLAHLVAGLIGIPFLNFLISAGF